MVFIQNHHHKPLTQPLLSAVKAAASRILSQPLLELVGIRQANKKREYIEQCLYPWLSSAKPRPGSSIEKWGTKNNVTPIA